MSLDTFNVENLSLPDELQKVLDQRISMNMIGDMNKFTQYEVAQSIPIAAANEGGGGVGIGYSQHAGQVTVADGTKEMAARIERVLTNDPGMGVARHVDAGYDEAKEFAKKAGVKITMADRAK